MTTSTRLHVFAALAFVAPAVVAAQTDTASRAVNEPIAPFRIAGNLYYVGAADVASYLVATPNGHILIDGGFEETAPQIAESIRQLGFRPEDVRVLLASHPHYDHAGGLAYLKRLSGATFYATKADAPLFERGGHRDPQFGNRFPFPPIRPDSLLVDGDSVHIGGTTLVARLTPGHTPGCTTWTTRITDGARTYHVVILGGVGTPPEYNLTTNARYPDAATDYRKQFAVLRSLRPDIVLGAHGSYFGFHEKRRHNTLVDSSGYGALIDSAEAAVERHVAREQIVIRDVTVIDGTGGPPRSGVDVLIAHGRLARIEDAGSFPHPGGARVIDGRGKFLIPGLTDMHAHVAGDVLTEAGLPGDRWERDLAAGFLENLLKFGVTTVRDPGGITADAIVLRAALRSGELDGPQLFTAGRILNASAFRPPPFAPVLDEVAVRSEVQWQALAGVDFIKVYAAMPPPLVAAAIDEAHALGLPVIGHVQRTTWTDAARMGIDGLEHAAPWSVEYLRESARDAVPNGMFARVYWLEHLDSSRVDEMIAELVANRVVVDPTLMAMKTKFFGNDARWTENPDLALVPPRLRQGWAAGAFTGDWTEQQFARAQRVAWPILLGFIKAMHDRGVQLVAGTDTPTPWIVPGPSMHDELQLLADAGIEPLAIIRIATFNAARALRREGEFGTIRPGLRADVVLLAKNPLEDISNTRAIELVIQNGAVRALSK